MASAFNSATESVVEGRVLVDLWRLRFESEAVAVEMPLQRLVLDVDDSAGGRIDLTDPEQPAWTISTFDRRLLQESHLRQHAHTRSQLRQVEGRGDLNRRLKLTLGFIGGFALLAFLASAMIGLMVRALVARVPVQWEQQLGETMLQQAKAETTFLEDPNLMQRLTNAVAPLLAALPPGGLQFQFHLLDERTPNACALPGGHVLVTKGLMELADRPEELAAVVSHEIAHVTQRHVFRKIVSSAGTLAICYLFAAGRGGVLSLLGAGSQLLVAQSFSQEYELEADAVGWNYLVAARIDPRALPDVLRKLEAVEAKEGHEFMPRALSSHPATDKRIRRLEARWKKLKHKTGFIQFDAAPAAR